jgi:hypothetical protein
MEELTFGQKAVGRNFNPSNDPFVDKMKQHYADIIDQLNELRNQTQNEGVRRHAEQAIIMAEDAQMRAVKAITWK